MPLFGEQFIKASIRHGLVAAGVIKPVTGYREQGRRTGLLLARMVTRTDLRAVIEAMVE